MARLSALLALLAGLVVAGPAVATTGGVGGAHTSAAAAAHATAAGGAATLEHLEQQPGRRRLHQISNDAAMTLANFTVPVVRTAVALLAMNGANSTNSVTLAMGSGNVTIAKGTNYGQLYIIFKARRPWVNVHARVGVLHAHRRSRVRAGRRGRPLPVERHRAGAVDGALAVHGRGPLRAAGQL